MDSNNKKRILVVDNESSFTHLLKLNLEQTGGYEVKEENDAKRILASTLEFKPDLVLLDIMMPGTSGAHAAAQLKENERLKNIPVVFVTAMVSKQETTSQGGIIGGNFFVAKPVGTRELVDCIEKQLGRG